MILLILTLNVSCIAVKNVREKVNKKTLGKYDTILDIKIISSNVILKNILQGDYRKLLKTIYYF